MLGGERAPVSQISMALAQSQDNPLDEPTFGRFSGLVAGYLGLFEARIHLILCRKYGHISRQ